MGARYDHRRGYLNGPGFKVRRPPHSAGSMGHACIRNIMYIYKAITVHAAELLLLVPYLFVKPVLKL